MRTQRVRIGRRDLEAFVCESMMDRKRGLQGMSGLADNQCMIFAFNPRRQAAHFHMGTVGFPIDIVWTTGGVISKIVTGTPGTRDSWVGTSVDAVIEFRGGYCKDHGLQVGSEILPRTAAATNNLLRTLTEAEAEEDVEVTPLGTVSKKVAHIFPEQGGSLRLVVLCSNINRMFEAKASIQRIVAEFSRMAAGLSYGERDRVVRVLHALQGDSVFPLLRVAQTNSQLPITYNNDVGAPPPSPGSQVGQMPDDMPGTHTDNAPVEQIFGYDPLQEQFGTGTRFSRKAGGEIHIKDRVRAKNNTDGLRRDDKGVVMEIQGDAIKVRFDGEPIPRWITRDLLDVDQPAEEVEKEIQEGEKGGGGEGGDAGGDEGGGLGDLLKALGG